MHHPLLFLVHMHIRTRLFSSRRLFHEEEEGVALRPSSIARGCEDRQVCGLALRTHSVGPCQVGRSSWGRRGGRLHGHVVEVCSSKKK